MSAVAGLTQNSGALLTVIEELLSLLPPGSFPAGSLDQGWEIQPAVPGSCLSLGALGNHASAKADCKFSRA